MKQIKVKMTEGFKLRESDIKILIGLLDDNLTILGEMADSNIDLDNLDEDYTFDELAGFEKTDQIEHLMNFLKSLKIK